LSQHPSEKTPIFRLLAVLLLPFMHVVARYRIHDGEKLPKTGAFVLSPNHYSEIDPVVIGCAPPVRSRSSAPGPCVATTRSSPPAIS